MGCAEAIGPLAAVAVIHTVITLILAVVLIAVVFWPNLVKLRELMPVQQKMKRKRREGTEDIDALELELSTQQLTRGAKEKPTHQPEATPTTTVIDYESESQERVESTSTPEPHPAVAAVRRISRKSITSVTSNLSRQFALRKSVELEDGMEPIMVTGLSPTTSEIDEGIMRLEGAEIEDSTA